MVRGLISPAPTIELVSFRTIRGINTPTSIIGPFGFYWIWGDDHQRLTSGMDDWFCDRALPRVQVTAHFNKSAQTGIPSVWPVPVCVTHPVSVWPRGRGAELN
jgi:hypothetical protein